MDQRPRRSSTRRPRWAVYRSERARTCRTGSGSSWSRCCRRVRGWGGRRSGPVASWWTGYVGGRGWARRVGMCLSGTGTGSRCMACSGGGSVTGSGRGVLAMLRAFADAAGVVTWQVSVDSTINRARQRAAGARRDPSWQAEPPRPLPAASRRGTRHQPAHTTPRGRPRATTSSACATKPPCTSSRSTLAPHPHQNHSPNTTY